MRYDYVFPVKGSEWRQVTVAWSDLIPVLPRPRALGLVVRAATRHRSCPGCGSADGGTGAIIPRYGLAIDDIHLEPSIPRRERAELGDAGDPLARVRAKLRNGSVDLHRHHGRLTDRQAALGKSARSHR